ncbi:MAG: sulfide-dependent adenosine diphosphate thiazole synthase [Phycisphaerae bacterium]
MSEPKQRVFHETSEKDVTRAIARSFAHTFDAAVESDVLIAGAGPSGLMCAKRLAERGVRVVLVERNNYLGGGFWLGGYLMNKVTVRAPAHEVLDELGVPHEEAAEGLHVADAPHACARLVAAACDAGITVANMTSVEDVVLRDGARVAGAVVNWTPVQSLPRQITCVDPVALEARVVVDATGHEAHVTRALAKRGLVDVPGEGAMWVGRSEDAVVERTGEVHPGLVAIGMAVAAVYGLPRMGPTFGAMLLSGEKGAEAILARLDRSDAAKHRPTQPVAAP